MDSSTAIERSAAEWLARRDSAAWSAADQAAFEAWLTASTAHRVAWLRLQAAWRESGRLKALGAGLPPQRVPPRGGWMQSPFFHQAQAPAAQPDAGPEPSSARAAVPVDLRGFAFKRAAAQPRRARLGLRLAGVAASLALATVLGLQWRQFNAVERSTYATAVGELRTVTMADGSQAQLSSASRVEVALSGRERRVEVRSGEVFFDVAKDPQRPFVVQAGAQRVVAVGTRFSVRSDQHALRVVVTEGRVRLLPAAPAAAPVLLSAGMVALADPRGVHVRTHPLRQAEELLSWRDGVLNFRNTPLAEAVAEFNRYHATQMVIDDPAVAAIPIGGSFRWSNTDAFVRLLEQGFALRAERRGERIILRSE